VTGVQTCALPILRLADVEPERVEWLWKDRIPLGKVSILDGDPGLGKSTLTLDLAARITMGRPMPDMPHMASMTAGGVVLLSAEDGLADTLRPRLAAAGADLARVHAFDSLPETGLPTIPEGLDRIEAAISGTGALLVVIDPLMALLCGQVNAHRDQDVRRALAPLAALADRTGAAVLVVRHLNKAPGSNALYRGGGSIGIAGAARSVLLVARDPEDEERRVLAPVKSNLGPLAPSLGFRLRPDPSTGAVAIEWVGRRDVSATALLAVPLEGDERSSAEEARDFLRDLLTRGPCTAKEANRAAREAGISENRLERARQSLRIRPRRQGFGPGAQYLWELPSDHAPHHVAHAPQSPDSAEHAEHDAEHGPNALARGSNGPEDMEAF